MRLGHLDHEIFGVILCDPDGDKRNRIIEYVELFRGTIDGECLPARNREVGSWRREPPRACSCITILAA